MGRKARYIKYRNLGFFPHEATMLSRWVGKKPPYFKTMVNQRVAEMEKAKKKGLSEEEFHTRIKRRYIAKGWTKDQIWVYSKQEFRKAGSKTKYDVWAMIRSYEDDFKDDHPEYTSPWKERQRNFSSAKRKYENTPKKW